MEVFHNPFTRTGQSIQANNSVAQIESHRSRLASCNSGKPLDISARFSVGVLAQLVECLVRNEKVRGSNPLGSTKFSPVAGESLGDRKEVLQTRRVLLTSRGLNGSERSSAW